MAGFVSTYLDAIVPGFQMFSLQQGLCYSRVSL